MSERRLYGIFKKKLMARELNAWIYKIPDTFGIGGKRPFDTIAIIQSIPFAIEFKAKGCTLTEYQAYQLTDFVNAGGEALVYREGEETMHDFIEKILALVEKRKEKT